MRRATNAERRVIASMRTQIIRRKSRAPVAPRVGFYIQFARHDERYYPWRFIKQRGKPYVVCRCQRGTYILVPLPINPDDWTIQA